MNQHRSEAPNERTTWGRAKLGRRRAPAMAISIPAGLAIGIGLGVLAAFAGIAGPNRLLTALVFAACLSVPSIALVYAAIVDRSTMRGAPDRPDESVESRWYEAAAAGALTDVVLVAGLAALALTFFRTTLDDNLVLAGLILVAGLSCGIRYAIARRRG